MTNIHNFVQLKAFLLKNVRLFIHWASENEAAKHR